MAATSDPLTSSSATATYSDKWRVILSHRMLVLLVLGFSSGLPLIATGSTLQAWMTTQQINLKQITLFALVGLPYSLKFLWAPIFDRFVPSVLGRRRGWLLITQFATFLAFAAFYFLSPKDQTLLVVIAAVALTFFSASQDIVADAFRRDSIRDEELGLGTAVFVTGYRIGMILCSAGALKLAATHSWNDVYLFLALFMFAGMGAVLLSEEPVAVGVAPRTFREAVVHPLVNFFQLPGAFQILLFILLYKLGDSLASSLVTPFFIKFGYSLPTIAEVGKTFGLLATIFGGIAGGYGCLYLGINRALWIFGFLQAITILAFSLLAGGSPTYWGLVGSVGLENFTSGLGTSAYLAFMGGLCNRRFSATQYALLSSVMGIPRTVLAVPTGWVSESVGWPLYFCFCAAAAVPGMLMLLRVAPWNSKTLVAAFEKV